MGLEAKIWASRLGFGLQDWDLGLETGRGGTKKEEKEMEKENEKIPHICESIGHQPLQGQCPEKGPTNQPTNQPTD